MNNDTNNINEKSDSEKKVVKYTILIFGKKDIVNNIYIDYFKTKYKEKDIVACLIENLDERTIVDVYSKTNGFLDNPVYYLLPDFESDDNKVQILSYLKLDELPENLIQLKVKPIELEPLHLV